MVLGRYEHELRVVLIKAYRQQLSREEAATQVKNILARFENDIAEAKKRVDDVIPHLRERTITVNEAEEEILLGK